MNCKVKCALAAGTGALAMVLAAGMSLAAENASGFYLLGSKTTMAGYLPPSGTYAVVQNYGYTGKANLDAEFAGLTLSGDIDVDAFYSLPTALWVADQEVLGGNLAFSLTAPIGYKNLSADAVIAIDGVPVVQPGLDRDNTAFGDPVLGATLGWHDGNLHSTLGTLINVPIGQWEKGNPVNIGFNHWGVDLNGALTYLNPQNGLELSGAAGVTLNFENPDTDYKTGAEFHFEGAAMLHVSQVTNFGLNGYFYQQLSGDSGEGARLGDFKGRVAALGPALNHTFVIGTQPVITNTRLFFEFGAENRLEGQAGYFNVTLPLGGP